MFCTVWLFLTVRKVDSEAERTRALSSTSAAAAAHRRPFGSEHVPFLHVHFTSETL